MYKSIRRQLVLGLLVALCSVSLFAGQSIVLTPSMTQLSINDPIYPQNQSWRVEFQIHNWTLPAAGIQNGVIFGFYGLGATAYLYPGGQIALEGRDPVAERAPCFVFLTGRTNAVVRFQKDAVNMRYTCEIWSTDGSGYANSSTTIQSFQPAPYGGGAIGYNVSASLGFLRSFTTILPLGGRPPTTADIGDHTEFRFDGNLKDSSGNGHNASGSATYVSTPNQTPAAFPRTLGAPFWNNWVSLRAGFPAQLDGSQSYSMADSSSSVTCQWQQLSGPTVVRWNHRNSTAPTITGLIFGSYTFQLTVTDTAGKTATKSLTVGAVATDKNGVVVNANPAADVIFGPMIAFGRNPWGYADERNYKMENLQLNSYGTPPSWTTPAENRTVSYSFFDPYANAITSLAADVTTTSTSITVASVMNLDLSSFPTQILVGSPGSWEDIRICSASGTTLTVCYDGRGFHAGSQYNQPPGAWKTGAGVWQAKVKGSGTHFLTTICPTGQGWPTSAAAPPVNGGTVTVTPGSATITGNQTNWSNSQTSLAIAIDGTHMGTPFTFFAYVSKVNGSSITLSRPYPSDADAGSSTYRIFSDQRNIVLHYVRSDNTDGYLYFGTAGCESDTELYLDWGWDNGYSGQKVAASPYSYQDGYGYVNDFSRNYYDMGLAHYAFYFRSGFTPSLTSARNIEDYWIRYPENGQGDVGGSPRDKSITGVFAAAVLDGDRASNWPGLRSYAHAGLYIANQNNCDDDLRETAYQLSWLALAAQFDPDPAQRAQWQNGMAQSYKRDSGCKGSDASFASGSYWNASSYPPVQVTNGSQTVTAASGAFPSSICKGVAWGTAMASNGSATLTIGPGPGLFVPMPGGNAILMVGGTRNGVRYDLVTQYDFTSGMSVVMSALWPGDSGTVYWMIQNDPNAYVASIASGESDPNFGQVFSCALTDSAHILLHRPWPGNSGTYGFSYYNLLGKGTQPFMAGIKTLQMRYAAQAYPAYAPLAAATGNWVGTVAFDQALKAISYGRNFPMCEPTLTDSGITDVLYRNTACVENSNNTSAVPIARARNAEAQNAMTVMYLSDPTDANRALGDLFYGATYGAPNFTQSGYWSDGVTASNLDDGNLAGYKWPGFFFGVGMAHQWPAARVGGVAPPQPRMVYVSFNPGSAASAKIIVTAPSGAQTTYSCGAASPCAVSVDDRQGTHWFQIQYFDANGQRLSESDPDLLDSATQ